MAWKSPTPKVGPVSALPKNELAPSHSGEFQLGTRGQSIYASVCVCVLCESAAIRKSNLINNEERPWAACH